MQVSVSEIQSWKRCKRQWSYYKQDLQKLISRPALELGSLIHEAHKKWLLDETIDLQTHFLVASNARVDSLKAAYLKNIGSEISEEELEKLYDLIVTGNQMCKNYQDFYKKPLPDGMKLLTPEQEIIVEIPNTDYSHSHLDFLDLKSLHQHQSVEHINDIEIAGVENGFGVDHNHSHYFKSILDALIADKSDNIYILEHKTYTTKPKIQDLNNNYQFLAYIWVAKQLNIGNVVGIAYDGMQKKVTGSLKELFYREILYRNEFELQEFENFLIADVQEMSLNTNFSTNRRWENCWDCNWNMLCEATSKGEDIEYLKNTFYKHRDRNV